MIELRGAYAEAKIFTDTVEQTALAQIYNLLNQPFMEHSKVRIMPDVHAGMGCVIGTTMTITDKVCPNLVGVDIGCGMETVKLDARRLEWTKLDKVIRERIPSGFGVRGTVHPLAEGIDLSELRWKKGLNIDRAYRSIGTLGGGNHFIEVGIDKDSSLYLIVHSGSRHLGLEIAKAYQTAGYEQVKQTGNDDPGEVEALVQSYKSQGRHKELSAVLKEIKKKNKSPVPRELAYVSGALLEDYLHDMALAQHFASLNRRAIVREIIKGMKLEAVDQFTTIHNYIDMEGRILRKGAVSAKEGERLVIPINMRDGSLICVGKGNPDWNQSAPHGAGRLMSRSAAKQSITLTQYTQAMEGVYSSTVNKSTIDEAPFAYKPIEEIIANIGETADVSLRIKPLYNFKAAE